MATSRRAHAQSAKRGCHSLPLPPTPGACAGEPSCGGRLAFRACPAVGACATRLGPAPPGPAPPVGAWPPRRTDALERVSALTAMADPTTQSPFVSSSSSSGQSQPQLGGCGAAGSAFCAGKGLAGLEGLGCLRKGGGKRPLGARSEVKEALGGQIWGWGDL